MEEIKLHPIYQNFGASKKGKIYNIVSNKNLGCDDGIRKPYFNHRFIWECFNGEIPDGYDIDHINRCRTDNRIENLQCVTMAENRKKGYQCRIDKDWGSYAHKRIKAIKAIQEDGTIKYFKNKSQCAKYYNISPAMVYLIVEKKNNAKNANTNHGQCSFEYAGEDDFNFENVPRKPTKRKA